MHDGYIYIDFRKSIYGMGKAGALSNKQLQNIIARHGYVPFHLTPGLLWHNTHPITFILSVNDFGIKYIRKERVYNLHRILT